MPLYRVLLLGAKCRCQSEHQIDCRNDDHAIDHTGRIAHELEIEVWDGNRLVARFPKSASDPLGT